MLALAMLPPEGRGGALRLPSGARRRLREARRAQLVAVEDEAEGEEMVVD